jgi:6-phosphogluconolactonase/glucosamine-6-phosphate isomerase/deaminase
MEEGELMQPTFSEFIQQLELERNNISYRSHFTKPEVKVITKTLKVIPERFKKIYFHAGRYAAGDRDKLASEAWAEYEKQEDVQ